MSKTADILAAVAASIPGAVVTHYPEEALKDMAADVVLVTPGALECQDATRGTRQITHHVGVVMAKRVATEEAAAAAYAALEDMAPALLAGEYAGLAASAVTVSPSLYEYLRASGLWVGALDLAVEEWRDG